MFTGLIEAVGTVKTMVRQSSGATVEINAPWDDLAPGESIAVDGACLTVTKQGTRGFAADVSHETLAKTIAGGYRAGTAVNLERALRLGDRLGGHLVSGHVDGTAVVRGIRRSGAAWDVHIGLGRPQLRYVAAKGSVALNGISLTVAEKRGDGVTVVIVPHTLSRTTIAGWRPGDSVNVELDLIAKYVETLLPHR